MLCEPGPSYPAHLAGVKGAKIDCFRNIAIRLSPGLANFKNLERGELESAAFEDFGSSFQ
jgi:hypothetical protein